MNKATLLSDETAIALGLNTDTATVNEALYEIGSVLTLDTSATFTSGIVLFTDKQGSVSFADVNMDYGSITITKEIERMSFSISSLMSAGSNGGTAYIDIALYKNDIMWLESVLRLEKTSQDFYQPVRALLSNSITLRNLNVGDKLQFGVQGAGNYGYSARNISVKLRRV